MNVYDFDKTIYKYDSSVKFFLFSIKHKPAILLSLPYKMVCFFLYKIGVIPKVRFKEIFFSFLKIIKNHDDLVKKFWDEEDRNINLWYKNQKSDNDIIISASPYFLVKEMCGRLGIKNIIATEVDINTGSFNSENCYGEEKVRRLYEKFPDITIDEFYSDSNSDIFLAKKAKKAYKIVNSEIKEWSINNE